MVSVQEWHLSVGLDPHLTPPKEKGYIQLSSVVILAIYPYNPDKSRGVFFFFLRERGADLILSILRDDVQGGDVQLELARLGELSQTYAKRDQLVLRY
jgi:hypothetical protein